VLDGLDVASEDAPTRYFLSTTLRDFRRAGIDRDESVRSRVRELQEELVRIGQDFDRNIRSDTRTGAFAPSALAGLPEDFVRAAPGRRRRKVRITTEIPGLHTVPDVLDGRHGAGADVAALPPAGLSGHVDVCGGMVERRHELARCLGYRQLGRLRRRGQERWSAAPTTSASSTC